AEADRWRREVLALPLAHARDYLKLDIQERPAAGLDVVLLAESVELQVNRVQARFGDLVEEAVFRRQPDAVRRHLDLGEAHFLGSFHDLRELRVDRRLAARELDRGD